MTDARDAAIARIQLQSRACCFGQGVMLPIILANGVAVTAIRGGATKRFNPTMFVRWHDLRSRLPTNPVRFFCQNNTLPVAERREGCRDSAHPCAQNCHVTTKLFGGGNGKWQQEKSAGLLEKISAICHDLILHLATWNLWAWHFSFCLLPFALLGRNSPEKQ